MNIGGSIKEKLTNQHPIIMNIRSKHRPHLLVLTDAQAENKNDIPDIQGYAPVDYKPCDRLKNNKRISGTVIYVRTEYVNKYKKLNKNKEHEIVWFDFLGNRYCSIYNRPYTSSDNKKE